MNTKNAKKEIELLTGMRFFAALHVVLFHNLYLFGFKFSANNLFFKFVSFGDAAVSFFFILSGFILCFAYQDKLTSKSDIQKYFISRFTKLYPFYFLGFILDLPRGLTYFFHKYALKTAVVKATISATAYTFMIQSWHPSLTPVWNSPAWSLSCEMFFYVMLIFLIGPVRTWKNKKIGLVLSYLVPIFCVLLIKNLTSGIGEDVVATFVRSFPLLRIPEFLIGVLSFFLINQNSKVKDFIIRHSNFLFYGSITFSISACVINKNFDHHLFILIFLVPSFVLMISAAFLEKISGKLIFSNKLAVRLGHASYAIYILHQPLKYYWELLFTPSLVHGLFYFLLLFLICYFLEICYERFFHQKLKKWILETIQRVR